MIKYTIPIKSQDNTSWRANIYSASYTGSPILLRGVADQSMMLSHDGATDEPYAVFIKSSLTLNLYTSPDLDINELQNAADKDFKVEIQKNNALYWVGYLVSEGIQAPLRKSTKTFSITATDGLTMLEKMPYVHNNLPGITAEATRCPMNYIRQILFSTENLGLMIPIRWTNGLRCTVFEGQDMFIGGVRWSQRGEGFSSYQAGPNGSNSGEVKTCGYILEELLKSTQCRIYQANGKWNIRRINDYYSGICRYYQIPGSLGVMKPTNGLDNIAKIIGNTGYKFINEDDLMTSIPGLKSFKVTYRANIRENILPNGDQDQVSTGSLLYWGFFNTGGIAAPTPGSLDGRGGYATNLINFTAATNYFTTFSQGALLRTGGLPLDAKTLVKRVSFSFIFAPKGGFPVFPDSGFIDWTNKPLQFQIVLNQGDTQYYLDEFGLWRTDINTIISPTVEALTIGDVAKINFDKFKGIVIPEPSFQPKAGDTCDIKVIFLVKPGQSYDIDNISITTEVSNDVYESIFNGNSNTTQGETVLGISSSFGGYMVSNYMTAWDRSDTECEFTDGNFYRGTLTGLCAAAVMRFRYAASKIFNGSINVRTLDYSFDEIYTIETLADRRFMPLNAKYNIEKCEVTLVAIEARNDDIALTEKFYGSNDEQLSN